MSAIGTTLRPLHAIAHHALADPALKGNARVWAAPYLQALMSCSSITDHYFDDDARSIVLYALSNLTGWRGDTARSVKAELKAHLAGGN